MKTTKQSSLGALFFGALFLTIGLAGGGVAAAGQAPAANAVDEAAAKRSIAVAYGKLPLAFEPNQGQSDPRVKFLCRGLGYSLFLTGSESVLVLRIPGQKKAAPRSGDIAVARVAHAVATQPSIEREEVLRFKLVGANTHPGVEGIDPLPGRSNYFIGNNPKQWHTNIPQYARVASERVYPGIDLVYYGRQRRLEYDFQVAPGADAGAIRFAVEGARKVELDAQGNLLLHGLGGDIIEQAPVIYQEIDGKRKAVAGRFELNPPVTPGEMAALAKSEMSVGFRVASYDRTKPLIIDPALVYSTYLGGSGIEGYGDRGNGIAVDGSGNAYVTGYTYSANFPTTAGAFQKTNNGGSSASNAFVTKLGPAGAALVYSTYLGGSHGFAEDEGDEGNGIAVDSSGDAYVTGDTSSTDFPTTATAFQKTNKATDSSTAFVTKLGPGGAALVYSTYLGGDDLDEGNGIAVDSSGHAYVTGYTNSSDFPTTAGAFQKTINPFSGGSVFVTKLGPAGAALVYSTYVGGSGDDTGFGIAVDGTGNAYVTGQTYSTNFPTTANAFQKTNKAIVNGGVATAFVTKLGPAGAALVYSTYLGGSVYLQDEGDQGNGIAVDRLGYAYVTGVTFSTDFPTTAGAFQTTNKATANEGDNAFVTKLGPAGAALVYSTYLGGSGAEFGYGDQGNSIAVDSSGNAYVTGQTYSTDFPTTAGAFQKTNKGFLTAFVTRLGPAGAALVYSTYLGGSGFEVNGDTGYGIAVDGNGNAYVTGFTVSTDFPTTAGAFQKTNKGSSNAFVSKINTE